MSFTENIFTTEERQKWIGVLSKSSCRELEDAWQEISEKPDYQHLRKPETGIIMARARAGGSGIRFNLGEITATRCTVKTDEGYVGCSYVMGRNHRHAELAALFDALLQNPGHQLKLLNRVILKLKVSHEKRKEKISKKSAATKVDFFTMVRGE
jgi:alpha-D-ribose 1-methylphosphonate 5-triphosphate synthase subunit PhnG